MDTNPGDGVCDDGAGNCTLRAAIMEANALPGADTINLQAGTYTIAIAGSGEDAGVSGDLDITSDLTISGAGADTTIIDGGGLDRVFHIFIWSTIEISGVTLQSGDVFRDGGGIRNLGTVNMTNSSVRNNSGGGIANWIGSTLNVTNSTVSGNSGGGITNWIGVIPPNSDASGGTLVVTDSTVSGNTMDDFGGALLTSNGGGIHSLGTADIIDSTVSGNSAGDYGGGIYNRNGTVTLSNSAISGNTADRDGGGIRNLGTVNMTNVIVGGNMAGDASGWGGGISNGGTLTITNSTVSANTADQKGGGISNGGTATLNNSTISGNSAINQGGGGIYTRGTLTLINSTVSGTSANGGGIFNDTGTLTLANSIIGDNRGDCRQEGSLISLGHNLDSDGTYDFNATGDLVNVDPLLGPIQDNGGPTFTHARCPGAPQLSAYQGRIVH